MLRDRIVAKGSKSHYNEMNVLSMHALIGAYKPEGHEWLDELKEVLTGNVDYAYDYITKHFQGVSLAKPEAPTCCCSTASSGVSSWFDFGGIGEARLGCGRRLAGRQHVPGSLQHPCQPCVALKPHQGSHAPP